jgi:uncharacterized cupin superfamily protein
MNLIHPTWDAEVPTGDTVLRAVRLAQHAGAQRLAANLNELEPGEVVAFPVGPAGVHQILNRSRGPARVLICATNDVPEVAEQVENDTLAVITPSGLQLVTASAPVIAP